MQKKPKNQELQTKSFSEGECDMADIIKNEIEFEYEDDIETEE